GRRAGRRPASSRAARDTRTDDRGERRTRRRRASPGLALVVLPAGELEVFPGHALVLGAGVAQEKRGMERRDEDGVVVWMDAPAQLADRLLRAQQRLRRDAAEREDHLGLDHGELVGQEGRAGRELVG